MLPEAVHNRIQSLADASDVSAGGLSVRQSCSFSRNTVKRRTSRCVFRERKRM